jgi:hypothetical protein
VAEGILLLDFPALFLLSQKGKDLLELVVFLAVVAELGLKGANAIDGTVVFQRQFVVEDPI